MLEKELRIYVRFGENFQLQFTKILSRRNIAATGGCGRYNLSCPTCTCFTIQDIFIKTIQRLEEASFCQVDRNILTLPEAQLPPSQG